MSDMPPEKLERHFIAGMERVAATAEHRDDALVAWARAPAFAACGMLLEGWQGELHREAHAALRHAMDADTPGMAWRRADARRGRASILRALRVDAADPASFYATFPLRILNTAEDECWIAAAAGCPRLFGATCDPCPELDISDVILWNPSTGALRLLGEAACSSTIILPYLVGAGLERRVIVYADPAAFFRAWADRRAEVWGRRRAVVDRKWTHGVTEHFDGGLPGALIIGDLGKVRLPLDTSVLEAGPGVDARRLSQQVYRRADLPRVQALAA